MSTLAPVKLDLIGPAELTRMLGVSRSRAVQLSADPRFPQPVAELTMGKVWLLEDVHRWADERGRTLVPLDASSSSGSTGDAKGSPSAHRPSAHRPSAHRPSAHRG